MLTLTQTRERLQALGMHPSKKLGQNFLVDPNIVRKSLELGAVNSGDTIVEVGPGLGTLTGALLEAGSEVFAVELDHRLAAALRETRADEPRFHLCEADAMDRPRGDFPGDRPFKIVANLPYAISTPWMEKILAGPLPERMVLMLQREAAERFTAEPGGKNIGAVSLFLAAAYRRRPGHAVARSCFYPAPDIDSVLLHLERLEVPYTFSDDTRALMRKFFTQRRKQIGSLARQEKRPVLSNWLTTLETNGTPPTLRPEALPLEGWLSLDQCLRSSQQEA